MTSKLTLESSLNFMVNFSEIFLVSVKVLQNLFPEKMKIQIEILSQKWGKSNRIRRISYTPLF